MSRFLYSEDGSSHTYIPVYVKQRKRYSFFSFLFDATLVLFTGGLWLIWIFCREMRKR